MNVVARGKIKVDARKAIAKLRDHMLVDAHLYGPEIARVAVGCGATTLDIDYDTDDVVFTFDGKPLDPLEIARARDHVLTPTMEGDGLALHALGIGVSAALGLGPSFVDVYVGNGQACSRVRFEPKHIAEGEEEVAPAVEALEKPARSPGPEGAWMRVHVRRRLGLDLVGRALSGKRPREIGATIERTRDASLAIRVKGEPIERTPAQVLLSIDLDEPAATRAVLEIVAPLGEPRALTEILERGVRIASYPVIGAWPAGEESLPVRVVIDLPKVPTNASRSEVRFDADIVKRIRGRIPKAFSEAIDALEAIVVHGAEPARVATSTMSIVPRKELLEDALGAIVAEAAIARRKHLKLPDDAERLLGLPLLRDAVGAPLALDALACGTPEKPLFVLDTPKPASEVLAPWLGQMVWKRGRAIERALASLTTADGALALALAAEGYQRRKRALEHPPSAPVLASSSAYLFKQAFEVNEGPFRGLRGEVALARRDGVVQRAGVAHVYVESRVLDTIPLSALSLPVDMALEWPGLIRAKFAYDGVERDEALSRATLYALRLAAIAVGEQLARKDPELARLAILAWMGATKELRDTTVEARLLGSLAAAPAWRTTTGTFVSLAAVEAYARRTGAVCVGTEGKGPAPDDRPVIVNGHADLLRPFLGEKVNIVPYDRALGLGPDASIALMEMEIADCPLKMPFSRPTHRGFVGLGPPQFRSYHAGARLLDRGHHSRNGPVMIVVDDPSAVPKPDWSGSLFSTPVDLVREEEAFLELVLDKCESGELAYDVVKSYLTQSENRLEDRLRTSKGAFKERWEKTAERIQELPGKLARARSERLRQQVLARPVEDPLAGIAGRRAVVKHADGDVTVMLDPLATGESAPKRVATLTYSGRIVGREAFVDLPLLVVIEIHRDSLLVDWAELGFEGKKWAKDRIDEAAKELVLELAKSPSFANDIPAMQLALALAEGSPLLSYSISSAVARATFPTVQGGSTTIGMQSKVPFGKLAYANETYRLEAPESPYDAPAVHIPETRAGALRHALLVAAGCELEDVTEPIARLQVRRARGARSPAPKLAGESAVPALRASLDGLRSTHLEGEIELLGGEPSEIVRVDERGIATPVSITIGIPLRVVFRGDALTEAQLAAELGQAAERLLRGVAAKVDELPAWVRERLRFLVCAQILKGTRSGTDAGLKVFQDIAGTWHSLRDLLAKDGIAVTSDPPPYPTAFASERMIVRANASEMTALKVALSVDDLTATLRAELQGEMRRNAPPLETIALSGAIRSACIGTFTFEREGVRGEIGILAPANIALRGIAVHTTQRAVTVIPDTTLAWPMVAVVDLDGLDVNRAFDALARKSDIDRIQKIVRNEGCTRLPGVLPAPEPPIAAATMRLPAPFPAGDVQCLGVFWIEPTWPEAPAIHLEAVDVVDPLRLPRITNHGAHHGILPVRGKVYIAASGTRAIDAALEHVLLWIRSRMGTMIGAASRAKRSTAADLDAYTWDLAMLGATKDRDVVSEAVRDRPNQVFQRVAARRAPQLLDPTGGRSTPAENVAREAAAAALPTLEQVFGPSPASVAPESFLAGVARKIVSTIGRPSAPPPVPPAASPLARELSRSLLALKLPGDPVAEVVDAKRGRAVRYVKASRRVELNAQHESVRALAGRGDAIVYLLMAALSEINRELEMVTDAEESAILVDLLRTLPAAAGR